MNPDGWLVRRFGRSYFPKKAGKVHFYAPIGALVYYMYNGRSVHVFMIQFDLFYAQKRGTLL